MAAAQPAPRDDRSRALGLCGTAMLHGGLLLAVGLMSWRAPVHLPEPITVELVAMLPTPLPAAEPAASIDLQPAMPVEPPTPPAPEPMAAAKSDPPPPAKPKLQRAPRRVAVPSPPTPAGEAAASAVIASEPATAPPVAAAPGAAPQVEDPAYLTVLLRHMERYREYPRAARLRHIDGQAMVRLALARDGRVLDAQVEQSSGHDILDRAALDTVRRAAPLPAPPAAVAGDRVELRVPFIYRLD